ncbi:acyloxyacyl hydrolase [Limisphaera sp. VF-2]|jgi:lipid A 3-O-deacylase|uniref:acyloxyacyl hydrolase n=1 Tax=Limisphaera sp. VF-2 TaxID=3400418 RepID=UPI001779B201|nr:acyloxyacyl hydrolase [Limisphaera sp.]
MLKTSKSCIAGFRIQPGPAEESLTAATPVGRLCPTGSALPRGAVWMLVAFLLGTGSARAESWDLQPHSVGWHASLAINQRGRDMGAGEAFAWWRLPWAWTLGSGWQVESHLTAGLGWLGGRGATAGSFRTGPAFSLRPPGAPFWIELGISPTVLTRHTFGGLDLGIGFQFTSYAGMNWDISRHWGLGYRFEHMSNASLSSSNPGLNSHTFTVYYRF